MDSRSVEQEYYQNFELSQNFGKDPGPKEKIQLNCSVINGTIGAQYGIILKLGLTNDEKTAVNLGQPLTEVLQRQDGTLHFNMSFILDYFFEKNQYVFLHIAKNGSEVVQTFTIAKLMGARGQKISIQIPGNSETFVISGENLPNNNLSLSLNVSIAGQTPNSKVFFVLKKMKSEKNNWNNSTDNFYNIKKSNVIQISQGRFNDMRIPLMFACNGNNDHPIAIELHSVTEGRLIGSNSTTINKLLSEPTFTIENYQLKCLVNSTTDFTFVDYLRGGTQISMSIAIDFTGSNGSPKEPGSLHAIGSSPNQYQMAIKSCGDILAFYDYDQAFPVFGYGAVLPGNYEANHCFPLNLSNDPFIKGMDLVLDTYCKVMPTLRFYGPTNFSPVINTVIKSIQNMNNLNVYHCLLIITDGEISDMDETISALVQGSLQPLSVIIIGVGEDCDFANMNELDCDNGLLCDGRGNRAARDIVQFVPFRKFGKNAEKLAEQVLAEIPRQIVDFYKMKNIPPGKPIG